MLKKVLLLSISLGTISNSISMDSIMDRYNIPISITMGTLAGLGAGFGSRLYTKNPMYNIGIGLGIGIGTYFISRLFSNDEQTGSDQNSPGEHVKTENTDTNGQKNHEDQLNHSPENGPKSNAVYNIDEIDTNALQDELASLGNNNNRSYREIYTEIIDSNFDKGNQWHLDLFWKSAEKGLLNIVKGLISKGADINTEMNGNITPLHLASYFGQLTIVKYLVNKGANKDSLDNDGLTPLQVALMQNHTNVTNVAELLITEGANVNVNDSRKQTPLHFASYKGYLSVVELLIKKGANINATSSLNKTPLDLAKAEEIKELLIHHGAKKGSEPN